MDALDFFDITAFTEPSSAVISAGEDSDSSNFPDEPLPIDFERIYGNTSHGFCIIA
jgi:hypothetical protein